MAQAKPTVSTMKMAEGTLKSLLSMGSSQVCTYSTTNTNKASVTGTVYVSSGKMRGDFVSTRADMKVNGHMIVDNGYTYMWTHLSNPGFLRNVEVSQMEPSVTPTATNNQAPDLNQSVSYSCQGWTEIILSLVFLLISHLHLFHLS